MKLYNTLSKSKEEFISLKDKQVNMYVCGVTVYDECHLGHARAYVSFDVLRRYLEYQNYEVIYVQNFTDIDDKIIAHAKKQLKEGEDMQVAVKALAKRNIDSYFEVMDALGVKRATTYPKATDHITHMIAMIEVLIKKGVAYASGGDVFFEVSKVASYGQLSGKHLEDLRVGERVTIDERKKTPMDFVLWKASKLGEPSWESPWGAGRPGWHIECSAMSFECFQGTFDIHGGGCDLIFPHHENEIAQSEAFTGKTFARYWVHNGFLTINKEKMSKSLGNFFILKDIFQKFSPESVRLFLLAAHYRSPIDFSDERLVEAEQQLQRGYEMLKNVKLALVAGESVKVSSDSREGLLSIEAKFLAGMDDDCNTAIAIACLFDLIHLANTDLTNGEVHHLGSILSVFEKISGILFLFQNPPCVVTLNCKVTTDAERRVQGLLNERVSAREGKNWELADALRDEVLGLYSGMNLEDTPSGPVASFWF